jgi:hemoglobin-like flavoprotein
MAAHNPEARRFHESLTRVKASADFYRLFYERFLAGSRETAILFQNRDMGRLQAKLRMTLDMVDENAADHPGLGMYLEMLGHMHEGLHISEDQIAAWREAALATAAECDPQFDATTRAAWEQVLDDLIAKMGLQHH